MEGFFETKQRKLETMRISPGHHHGNCFSARKRQHDLHNDTFQMFDLPLKRNE